MSQPQRHLLVLQGDSDWLNQQAGLVFQRAEANKRCWLSDDSQAPAGVISSKQALQQLGRSNQLVIFDARDTFSADALGALIGTLSAGGWLLLLLPAKLPDSLWLQRFLACTEGYATIQRIRQGQALPQIEINESRLNTSAVTPTTEQKKAIEAVLQVVSGHRRRPLLLTSDRGRGKTALLGMAAAELLKQGKRRILVTAPAIANIEALFEHATLALSEVSRSSHRLLWQEKEIQFIAPDLLLAEKPCADLLIVDEAAALPAQILEAMLAHYSRLVFATTEHGYEGTGRGFAVRFRQTLDRLTPDWRAMTLDQPVRWAEDDNLEAFSFNALMLDAEPVEAEKLADLLLHEARFAVLGRQQLAGNENQLREIFGLMVLAHYRTRPADLQMLLDRDDISVMVLQARGHIIASAWLVKESPIDSSLARQVFDGQRRLKGQLIPQTLLAHSGVMSAAACRYQRIIRIAVHPALQGQGLGTRLLQEIRDYFAGQCDVLGTSFALEPRLLAFWLNNAYQPVRVGQKADEVSGQRAGVLLQALTEAGESVVMKARQTLQRAWPFLQLQSLSKLDVRLVVSLSQHIVGELPLIVADEQHALESFAFQQRPYESTEPVLWKWLHHKLATGELTGLAARDQALLVKKIVQGQSFSQLAESLSLAGRQAIITQCRRAVASLLRQSQEK